MKKRKNPGAWNKASALSTSLARLPAYDRYSHKSNHQHQHLHQPVYLVRGSRTYLDRHEGLPELDHVLGDVATLGHMLTHGIEPIRVLHIPQAHAQAHAHVQAIENRKHHRVVLIGERDSIGRADRASHRCIVARRRTNINLVNRSLLCIVVLSRSHTHTHRHTESQTRPNTKATNA